MKKASPLVAGGFYLYGIQENHERFKSPYNAFKADVLDVLPIASGAITGLVVGGAGSPIAGLASGVLVEAYFHNRVLMEKNRLEESEKYKESLDNSSLANKGGNKE